MIENRPFALFQLVKGESVFVGVCSPRNFFEIEALCDQFGRNLKADPRYGFWGMLPDFELRYSFN